LTDHDGRAGPVEIGTARVEAFSDAVMAVIMTIMAFELRAPKDASWAALKDQGPSFLVYILSFTFIAIYWNNHHHLMRAAARINATAMWANVFLLFWLSLIPVMTEWIRNEGARSLPAAMYGVVSLASGFAYALLVRALIRANGKESAVAKAIGSDVKGYASLVLYAAAVGLAFVNPWIAFGTYAGVAAMWFIPDRRFTRG
jgi:uncharacterized membrane protein